MRNIIKIKKVDDMLVKSIVSGMFGMFWNLNQSINFLTMHRELVQLELQLALEIIGHEKNKH